MFFKFDYTGNKVNTKFIDSFYIQNFIFVNKTKLVMVMVHIVTKTLNNAFLLISKQLITQHFKDISQIV